MPESSTFTCVVNVLWQAVPESIGFYQLPAADQDAVSQTFVRQLGTLIPEADQAKWRNLVLSAADWDEVAAKVNTLLKSEVAPPVGTELVLSATAVVWVPMSGGGHGIMHSPVLKDAGTTALRNWTVIASQGGVSYAARLALRYEVLVARLLERVVDAFAGTGYQAPADSVLPPRPRGADALPPGTGALSHRRKER